MEATGKKEPVKITEEDYNIFCNFLEESCGIVLGENKIYLVTNRLSTLMAENNVNCILELVKQLKVPTNHVLRESVIDAMTTNETNWFRDQHPYQILKEKILPEYKDKRKIRIWSSACSSGQEPYTISICISEFLLTNPNAFIDGVEIIATDISPTMLEKAKKGEFDYAEMARGISEDRKKMFFEHQKGGSFKIRDREKDRVTFRTLNLLSSFVLLGKFDVIFCRNVLIYFSSKVKMDIVGRMSANLRPKGYLILGASESIGESNQSYQMINCKPGVVYQKR